MSEVLQAIGISAGILFPVVILIVIISMAAVNRGEAAQHKSSASSHDAADSAVHVEPIAAPAPAKPAKAGSAAAEEVPVGMILLLGVGLFTLMMLLFLAISLVEHAG